MPIRKLWPIVSFIALYSPCLTQSKLPQMPGYENYQTIAPRLSRVVQRGEVQHGRWVDGGKGYTFEKEGKAYRFDLVKKTLEPFTPQLENVSSPRSDRSGSRGARGFAGRGRQLTQALDPSGKWKALYKEGNVWLSLVDGTKAEQITQDGSLEGRIKYGTASWVYGEELSQNTAMGFSPNGEWLWFYRFNESDVGDYYLTRNNLSTQNQILIEPYPKAGASNPLVDLFVYSTVKRSTNIIDSRSGQPFGEGLGHYVYGIRWSTDGKELWFHRTNRWQNILEFCGADPSTGAVRVIAREENPTAWTENLPDRVYLDELANTPQSWKGKAFWITERNGYRNYDLLDLKSGLRRAITSDQFEYIRHLRIDLTKGLMWCLARSGDNPYKAQMHEVRLDGTGSRRLTDPRFNHTVNLSPDGENFVDVAEAIDEPPTTRLIDSAGAVLATLATSDLARFHEIKLSKEEGFAYPSSDGKTKLYGRLSKPPGFDPSRKYPLLVSVYAGPESSFGSERFESPNPMSLFGFLVAEFASRGTTGRGLAFRTATYLALGQAEIDDQAAGVRFLAQRPYVDAFRVGITGSSYGGYASLLCMLRYPELFHAAVANSSVTDWRNYDTIYTERFMRTPQANPRGYERASAMTYVKDLRGSLMVFYGTADDNVHPANTYQLVAALQKAGKSFEVQVGPDQGHSAVNWERMMEFFIENLVLRKPQI